MVEAGMDMKDRLSKNCSVSGFIDRSIWTSNTYYDDYVEWEAQNPTAP
jgi:hypothetical protein